MSKKIKRIKRDIYLIKYRKTPLLEYEKETDTEVFYFPKSKYFYWIKLEEDNSEKLITEFIKLLELMELNDFIFLDAKNKSWISKETYNRTDYKPLQRAVKYFKSLKINTNFNGGVRVGIHKMKKFLRHFHVITGCDSGFFDYYFSNINQTVLFHLHYSGEFKILMENKKMNKKFIQAVKQTKFMDAFINENITDRL